jgi:hypothetical protein
LFENLFHGWVHLRNACSALQYELSCRDQWTADRLSDPAAQLHEGFSRT